jgi:hypothetical protein
MNPDENKLLLDIKNAIDSIDEHLEKRRNFNEYKSNKTKRRAVEREFCEYLEYQLSDAFKNSLNLTIRNFWCDGIIIQKENLSIQNINRDKEIQGVALVGKNGQERYLLILRLGNESLEKYRNNFDLQECVREPSDEVFFEIDLITKTLIINLY